MSTLVHGTNTAYTGSGGKRPRKGCRCARCREAHRVWTAERRATVKLPPPEHPAHGTRGGYDYYQCRCSRCVAASRAARRDYYQRNRDAVLARAHDRYLRKKTGGGAVVVETTFGTVSKATTGEGEKAE